MSAPDRSSSDRPGSGAGAPASNGAGGNGAGGNGAGGNGAGGNGAGGNGAGGDGTSPGGVTSTIEALSAPELVPAQRRSLVRALARQVPAPPRWRPGQVLRWVADALGEIAPHLPVRDLATLRRHHDGLAGDALADRLVRNAARATAGVGAASGGLAAVKWTVPPALLSAPVLLGVETLAVVALEVKLAGELHAAYQVTVPGDGAGARAAGLLQSWAQQRGVQPLVSGTGVGIVLGTATRKELADRLGRRFGGNLPTLAPLLVGAGVAAYLNHRATRRLGSRLCADLAQRGLPR